MAHVEHGMQSEILAGARRHAQPAQSVDDVTGAGRRGQLDGAEGAECEQSGEDATE